MIRQALILTSDEWAHIADWLHHADEFERDSQRDAPEFQWPIVSGPLLDKIERALADGCNVVVPPEVLIDRPTPEDEQKRKSKSRRKRKRINSGRK